MHRVTDTIEIQQVLVAEHIAGLEREAAAIRAERARDHLRVHAESHAGLTDQAAVLSSARARLGRWLVAMGESLAGTTREVNRSMAQSDPCGDGPDNLAPAA